MIGGITSHALTTAVKQAHGKKALKILEESSSSEEITDEKMLALLKIQGVTMNEGELKKCRTQYNSLSEKDKIKLLAHYADTPLWPMLAGGTL